MKRIVVFLLLSIPKVGIAQVSYSITDLGAFSPTAINSWGQVVGDYHQHAYIWSRFGGLKDLGLLANGTFSSAAAINDLGAVVGVGDGAGTVRNTNQYGDLFCAYLSGQPFLWTFSRGMQGLGDIALTDQDPDRYCSTFEYATGVNILGTATASNHDFDTYIDALMWTMGTGVEFVPGNLFDSYQSRANAINNHGIIAGENGTYFLDQIDHATIWSNGIAIDLGSFLNSDPTSPGFWDYCSAANAINDLGQVVGWSATKPTYDACYLLLSDSTSPFFSPAHAFIWTSATRMSDLGTLPGDLMSSAQRVNYFGQVIGVSGNTVVLDTQNFRIGFIGRPFVWSHRNGMRDLNTLIPRNSGWMLNTATDINVWGQIVGTGTRNGHSHGYLLTPRTLFGF